MTKFQNGTYLEGVLHKTIDTLFAHHGSDTPVLDLSGVYTAWDDDFSEHKLALALHREIEPFAFGEFPMTHEKLRHLIESAQKLLVLLDEDALHVSTGI